MNCLDLFSGTGSVGKVCKELGGNVVSVDLELPATHECDIMDFDYKQYPKDYFSVVWASPPCVNYSHLKKCWYGRKLKDGIIYTAEQNAIEQEEADKLVMKSLEIINYFNPEVWFMENPQTGNLKNREIVKGIPFYDVDYCMYSDWGYRKRTRIWTNKKDWNALKCDNSGACGNMVESTKQHKNVLANGYEMIDGKKVVCNTKEKRDKLRQHNKTATGGSTKINGDWVSKGTTNRLDRYRVPPDLIYSLFLD